MVAAIEIKFFKSLLAVYLSAIFTGLLVEDFAFSHHARGMPARILKGCLARGFAKGIP